MPTKSTAKPRSWGTRFDQLSSSPPPSPEKNAVNSVCNSAIGESGALELDNQPQRREDRLPHDASIFVGSLPASVDNAELTRMLSELLAPYNEVRSIKVVRDNKGGVCAFVQCEDTASATGLIDELHRKPPPAFAGRFLRFERARALRALLISYRAPMQHIPSSDDSSAGSDGKGRTVEMELPTAIKIWRPRGTRYPSIYYNVEASEHHQHHLHVEDADLDLYLEPVSYDEQTVRQMIEIFGPTEYCRPLALNAASPLVCSGLDHTEDQPQRSGYMRVMGDYPPPHDSARAPGMDNRCWEVKWAHRDDAVSALMTLRRIPHLTVSWAHQAGQSNMDVQSPVPFQSPRVPPFMPPNSTHFNHGSLSHSPKSAAAAADVPAERNNCPSDGEEQNVLSSDVVDVKSRYKNPTKSDRQPLTVQTTGLKREDIGSWHVGEPRSPFNNSPLSPQSAKTFPGRSVESQREKENIGSRKVQWTDEDFPPLIRMGQSAPMMTWDECVAAEMADDDTHNLTGFSDAASSPISSLVTPRNDIDSFRDPKESQTPQTPEYGLSSFSSNSASYTLPRTPAEEPHFSFISPRDYHAGGEKASYQEGRLEKSVDPTTIFVGGLEMYGPHAWDEAKIRNLFQKFGVIEELKVIYPSNHKSAFAFVRFSDVDAPARAIAAEHNRMYYGRTMRVQLRDFSPTARPWNKLSRGRGNKSYHGYGRHPDTPRDETGVNPEDAKPISTIRSLEDMPIVFDSLNRAPAGEVTLIPPPDDGEMYLAGKGADTRRESGYETESRRGQLELSAASHNVSSDWQQEIQTSGSATSSSLGSSASASVPIVTYSAPHPVGYYPPPWVPQFHPSYAYAMHFGYPGYHFTPPPQMPVINSVAGPDTGAAPVVAPNPWPFVGHMYTPPIPYTGSVTRGQSADQAQPNATQETQAPLAPAGFIQGEQGTLIPVYNPDALNNYMSNAHINYPHQLQPQVQNVQNNQQWRPSSQSSTHQYFPYHPVASIPAQDLQSNQNQSVPAATSWAPNASYRPGYEITHHPPMTGASHPTSGQTLRQAGGMRGTQFSSRNVAQRDAYTTPPRRQNNRRTQFIPPSDSYSSLRSFTSPTAENKVQAESSRGDFGINPAPMMSSLLGGSIGHQVNDWHQKPHIR